MPTLRRVLGFRDLFLFYIVTGFSIRWTATAAAAGPSAIVIWIIAALGLFVPLVFTVLELSSRYPDEGGIYVWSKRAFGPFAAFITGWTYWGSNLPYFPGVLYFAAANASRHHVVESLRAGDTNGRARVRAEHEREGRHLLVHDCVRLRRRRKRIDNG